MTEGYNSVIPFLYNCRDGVITDENGLYYMRARYYSPDLRRFVNADIVRGVITDSTSLNRYAYVNGNPVTNIDPLGLDAIIITADHAAMGFGHTSIIVEDTRNDTWHYFYWGDEAAYFTEVPMDKNGIDSLEDFNNWLNSQDLPYSTKNYTSSIFVDGNFESSVDYYNNLVNETEIIDEYTVDVSYYGGTTRKHVRENTAYSLLSANCLQMTLKGFKKGVSNDNVKMSTIINEHFENVWGSELVPNIAESAFYDVFLNRSFTKRDAIGSLRDIVIIGGVIASKPSFEVRQK